MKKTPGSIAVLAVVLPVLFALTMVSAASIFATLHVVFADGGFVDGWSMAWDRPLRLAAVSLVWIATKTLDRAAARSK